MTKLISKLNSDDIILVAALITMAAFTIMAIASGVALLMSAP